MEIGIYSIFGELVHAQKQFAELPGHFVVKGEVIFYIFFLMTIQSHSPPLPPLKKKFPNSPIFNDFTACHVCVPVQLIWKAVHKGLNVFFPKGA